MEKDYINLTTREQRLGLPSKRVMREMTFFASVLVILVYALYVIPLATELFLNK